MPLTLSRAPDSTIRSLGVEQIRPNPFSIAIYGDPIGEIDDLTESIRKHGILVPLVAAADVRTGTYELISGHRRLASACVLGLTEVPCEIRTAGSRTARRRAVLEYNRQRRKTFSQMMREADALEGLLSTEARRRQTANLRQFGHSGGATQRRDSDDRKGGAASQKTGRTDTRVADAIGLGGKDLYRQARSVWRAAAAGDPRAQSSLAALDSGTKTIHAAYKDLRRRDRFTAGFRPTPYDVWPFRHDHAFGIPHPGAIPPAIVAHTLHYYTAPGALVVDPMAGGGTTLDVCQSMGRRCLAYDLHPTRPEIVKHDVSDGFPQEASECDLVFCDPPYHTMRARWFGDGGVDAMPLHDWDGFLRQLASAALTALRPGGFAALLLANQTEKDLPAGWGYIDHALLGYQAFLAAGFLPERRISCPMAGAYLPQQIQRARAEGRMLGQVRDLLIMRKPLGNSGLRYGFATREFVDLTPHEGVGEGRIATDDRLGE
jgi:hypothetical protein